jgi:hypothetical protein
MRPATSTTGSPQRRRDLGSACAGRARRSQTGPPFVARSSSIIATGASREISGSVLQRPADGFESFGVIQKNSKAMIFPSRTV